MYVVKIVLMIDSSFVAKCNTKWSTCSASPGGYTKDIYCCSGLLYNSLTSVNVEMQLLPAAVCGCLPQQPVIPASCSPWTLKGVSFPTHFFSFGTIDLQFRNSDFCYQLSLVYTGPFDQDCISLYAWTVVSKDHGANSSGFTWCQAQVSRRFAWYQGSELDIKHSTVLDIKLRSLSSSKFPQMSWPHVRQPASIFEHHQSYMSTIEWLFNECTFAIWSTKVNF